MAEADLFEEHVDRWMEKCKDYPSRAILAVALAVAKEQEKRLDQNRGQLDAKVWSRHSWS